MISKMPSFDSSQPLAQEISQVLGKSVSGLHKQHSCPENLSELGSIPKSNEVKSCNPFAAGSRLERTRSIHASSEVSLSIKTAPESQEISGSGNLSEVKKPDAIVIPEDFLCPISLELMRDPVIVATGQVKFILYEAYNTTHLFFLQNFQPTMFRSFLCSSADI